MLRSMLPLGFMFLLPKFLDMKDPLVIRVAYIAYAAVAVVSFLLTRGLVDRVTKARQGASGDVAVWLPAAAPNPLAFLTGASPAPAGPSFKKTTLRDHEIQLATEKENAMVALAVPLALSYFMGAHIMLVMNVRRRGARGARVACDGVFSHPRPPRPLHTFSFFWSRSSSSTSRSSAAGSSGPTSVRRPAAHLRQAPSACTAKCPRSPSSRQRACRQ